MGDAIDISSACVAMDVVLLQSLHGAHQPCPSGRAWREAWQHGRFRFAILLTFQKNSSLPPSLLPNLTDRSKPHSSYAGAPQAALIGLLPGRTYMRCHVSPIATRTELQDLQSPMSVPALPSLSSIVDSTQPVLSQTSALVASTDLLCDLLSPFARSLPRSGW